MATALSESATSILPQALPRQETLLYALYHHVLPYLEKNGLTEEGWRNALSHCVHAGVAMYLLMQSTGESRTSCIHAAIAGFLHDADQRTRRSGARIGADSLVGRRIMIPVNWGKLGIIEGANLLHLPQTWERYGDVISVTGCNWPEDAPDCWTEEQQIMRYVDSVTANQLDQLGYVPFAERIGKMMETKKPLDEMGISLYGESTFQRLLKITEKIERRIYDELVKGGFIPRQPYSQGVVVEWLNDQARPLADALLA